MTRIEQIKAEQVKGNTDTDTDWLIERNAELLTSTKAFVRWAADCWGVSEILPAEALAEIAKAEAAIAAMEKES